MANNCSNFPFQQQPTQPTQPNQQPYKDYEPEINQIRYVEERHEVEIVDINKNLDFITKNVTDLTNSTNDKTNNLSHEITLFKAALLAEQAQITALETAVFGGAEAGVGLAAAAVGFGAAIEGLILFQKSIQQQVNDHYAEFLEWKQYQQQSNNTITRLQTTVQTQTKEIVALETEIQTLTQTLEEVTTLTKTVPEILTTTKTLENEISVLEDCCKNLSTEFQQFNTEITINYKDVLVRVEKVEINYTTINTEVKKIENNTYNIGGNVVNCPEFPKWQFNIQSGFCNLGTGNYQSNSGYSTTDLGAAITQLSIQIANLAQDNCIGFSPKLEWTSYLCNPELDGSGNPVYPTNRTIGIGSALTGVIKEELQTHKDLCDGLNTLGSAGDAVLIADPKAIFRNSGYYLSLRWGLREDPYNKRYQSVTQLISPNADLRMVNNLNMQQVWCKYFENLYVTRGNQYSALWCQNKAQPIYSTYCNDINEGKRFLSQIRALSEASFDNPVRMSFPVYTTERLRISNVNKQFVVVKAVVINKSQYADTAQVIYEWSRKTYGGKC